MTDPKEIAADIARELREHPERWTQGRDARDSRGAGVDYSDPSAVCWCLAGHVDRRGDVNAYVAFRVLLRRFIGNSVTPVSWNDTKGRTVDEVIELCERIARS